MKKSTLSDILVKNKEKLSTIPFIPAAFPTADKFWDILEELADNGADIIEIGVPFSDPVADGPTVAVASQIALENGGSLEYIFEGLSKSRLSCGIVLMGYVNPFIQFGWLNAVSANKDAPVCEVLKISLDSMMSQAAAAGVQGLIVPDLPLEESLVWQEVCRKNNLDLLPLVGPNTSLEKMKSYSSANYSGYVYVVSVMGTTGVREGLPPEVSSTLKTARQAFDMPMALGFGLSSPEQLAVFPPEIKPDAAVFGSALIKHLEAGKTAAEFMRPWNA